MIATVSVRVSVRLRWWLKAYLYAVGGWSLLTGLEPDMAKVARMVKRGTVARVRDA